jgi:hypothetical protein
MNEANNRRTRRRFAVDRLRRNRLRARQPRGRRSAWPTANSMVFVSGVATAWFKIREIPVADHCEKNRRGFSQWSGAIRSKIPSCYDTSNDHCEKNVRATLDFSQCSGWPGRPPNQPFIYPWSFAIKSKIPSRYDMGHDHFEAWFKVGYLHIRFSHRFLCKLLCKSFTPPATYLGGRPPCLLPIIWPAPVIRR